MACRVAFGAVIRVFGAVIRSIERRPWIPLAIYLGVFALFVLVAWIPIANLIDSQWRPLPVLSASAKLMIDEVVYWIYRLLYAVGVVSVVVVPFVMLCAMRFKSAFYTLLMGITGIAVSVTFMMLTAPIWFVLGIEDLDARQEMGKDKTVKVYEDYAAAEAKSKDLGKIIPPGATDITVVHQVYFQGYSMDFRCSISKKDLERFAEERGYVFKVHNLLDDINHGDDFRWHDKDDALFSQFPDIENGQVVNHHPDGYLRCEAIHGYNGGKRAEEQLLYLYDAKCSILWVKCSR